MWSPLTLQGVGSSLLLDGGESPSPSLLALSLEGAWGTFLQSDEEGSLGSQSDFAAWMGGCDHRFFCGVWLSNM